MGFLFLRDIPIAGIFLIAFFAYNLVVNYRGQTSRLIFFFTLILISLVFSINNKVNASDVTVTQQVVDNSSSGGTGGGGTGGGTSSSPPASPPSSPPVAETPPSTPPSVPPPTEAPPTTPTTEVTPSTPAETTTSAPPATTGGVTTGGTSGSVSSGTGAGGFVNTLGQAANSIVQGLNNAFSIGVQGVKNLSDQAFKISQLVSEDTGKFIKSNAGKVVTAVTTPVGVISGGVAVASQILISTTTITSFSDIWLLLLRGIGLILGLFRRKRKPWGTVYDSVTKRPLDPAYVILQKEGEEVSDAITDLDGRFGFFVPSGRYSINAAKTNYAFPSKKLENKDHDEMYVSIYHGDVVENAEGGVITRNIPLDPVNFDWNEFEKNKKNLFRLYSEKERKWKRGFDFVYRFGFLGALLAAYFNGNYFNYAFVVFYFLINIYQTFFITKRIAVTMKYAGTNEPIPYSIIRLFSAETGIEVKSVVSDHLGRFYMLVGQGKYYAVIDAKQSDASYKRIYKSDIMDLKNGIIPSDIIVPQDVMSQEAPVQIAPAVTT